MSRLPHPNAPIPLSSHLQTFPHKLPLGKAHPPFTRPLAAALIQAPMQPTRQLLPHLADVRPQRLGLISVSRALERLVERKTGLAGQTELLEREVCEEFLGGRGVGIALRREFLQALGEEEDPVDEQAVGRAFDLKVAEEGVGAEEGEDFVEDVVGFGVWVDVERRDRGWERGQRVGGAARFGPQREEGEVACR
jgi:hypothetical protein